MAAAAVAAVLNAGVLIMACCPPLRAAPQLGGGGGALRMKQPAGRQHSHRRLLSSGDVGAPVHARQCQSSCGHLAYPSCQCAHE